MVTDAEKSTTFWMNDPKNLDNFFASVKECRPYFCCVNDDWPKESSKYETIISIFRQFLEEEFPEAGPWEVEEGYEGEV